MSNEITPGSPPEDAHADAAAALVDRARYRHGDEIAELCVFGSTVRGDARGRASDVAALRSRTRKPVAETESLCTVAD